MTSSNYEKHSNTMLSANTQTSCTPKQPPAKGSQEVTHELPSLDGSHLPTDGPPSRGCNAELHQAIPVEKFESMPPQTVECPAATATQHRVAEVAVLHKDNLSYQQFVGNFMQRNLPVMIQVHSCLLQLRAAFTLHASKLCSLVACCVAQGQQRMGALTTSAHLSCMPYLSCMPT